MATPLSVAPVPMPANGPVAVTLAPEGLPPITFSDGTGPDSTGVEWIVEDVDGWDMADVDSAVLPRFGVDGSWIGAGFYRSRFVTLKGILVGSTLAAAQAGSARLLAASGMIRTAGVLVVHEEVPQQAVVRLAGRVRLDRSLVGGRAVRFEVPLVAADPRKYGTVEESKTFGTSTTSVPAAGFEFPLGLPFSFGSGNVITGGTAVVVGGTVPTYPRLTFRGPSTAPSITNVSSGNLVWRWTGTLSAGQTLEVDFDAASVLLGGTASRYHLVDPASIWWPLVPGQNVLRYDASGTGTGDVTVRWRSAWL